LEGFLYLDFELSVRITNSFISNRRKNFEYVFKPYKYSMEIQPNDINYRRISAGLINLEFSESYIRKPIKRMSERRPLCPSKIKSPGKRLLEYMAW
jgi:hypothetical protein